ncbi:MAG: carboxypeptidase-like regulatory domain-containing protein [Deltaproteobacteria bacterium]|nr:carboxypeptidase-like regulatory domain-containing protein [Deltaproteobacteria bacterium]
MRVSVVVVVVAAFSGCQCGLEPLSQPPGSVSGVVCDEETGLPRGGSTITIESGADTIEVEADDDGEFRFDKVPAGEADVVFPGRRVARIEVPSGKNAVVDDEACRELPGDTRGDIEGTVCNAHIGDKVVDADVVITLSDGSLIEDRTDAEGRFTLVDVPVGDHVVRVTAPGFGKSELVTVIGGEVVVVDVGGRCGIPAPGSLGGVRGRVCSPDGGTWLVDATASIVPAGDTSAIADRTDVDGRYLLEDVPAGEQLLVIEKGSFRTEIPVVIPAGSILELDEEECALETEELRIAVVRGSQFDHVENVLGNIGVDVTTIDVFDGSWADELLGADERVRDYDILFLNCRSAEPAYLASTVMQDRLRAFVAAGGSLHASDQAYDLIEVTFPDKIDFLGEDLTRGAADRGAIADVVADVVDDVLASGLGRSTANLHYALETWSTMTAVGADVDVYLRADSPLLDGTTLEDVPQIVGFGHGEGRIIYSSFHQEPGSHPDQVRLLELLMFEL